MPFDPRQQMNPSAPGMTVWQRFAAMQQPQQQPQQQGAPGQPPPQAAPMGMNSSFISAIKEQMEKDNQPEPSPQSVNMDGQVPPTPNQQTSQSLAAGAQEANQVAQMGAQLKMARGGPVHMADGGGLDLGGMTSGSLFGTQPGFTFRQAAALGPEEEEAEGPDSYQAMLEKRMADEGSDAPVTSRDKWMALLQASLGTMAAAGQPGSTALGAIGQGGLTGLQGLREVQAQRAKEKMSKDALLGQLEQHKQTVAERRLLRAQSKEQREADRIQDDKQFGQTQSFKEMVERNNARQDVVMSEIFKQNANTAAQKARDDAAAAPTGVEPPSIDQASSVGIPIKGVVSPYVKISKGAQERLFLSNEKLFEQNRYKNLDKQNEAVSTIRDLDRMNILNDGDITGPSNKIFAYGAAAKALSPDRTEFVSLSDKLTPMLRGGFPGAASELDREMFKSSGPTIDKQKSVNSNRIVAIKTAIQNGLDRDSFDRNFFSIHSHMNGADEKWREYLEANPIFLHGKGIEDYTINPERLSYRDWFRKTEYGGKSGAGGSPGATPQIIRIDENGDLIP